MICVSIAAKTADECLRSTDGLEFAEIRIDAMGSPSAADMKKIFHRKSGVKLIATCRPGKLEDGKRRSLLLSAISAGAAYVDVEADAPEAYKREIVAAAKKVGCRVIVSFHDYGKTPPREELLQAVGWCFDSGADIAKIACKANCAGDSARLLGLLDNERRLAVVGMGKAGRITRIAAPLLGSAFTYATEGRGKETAEGQMGKKGMEKIIEEIADG
jgi:3-dehydroquinate dehydratase type I